MFLRAYAQKTPINEYKQEAFGLFEKMLHAIREDVTRILMTAEFRMTEPEPLQLPDLPDFLTQPGALFGEGETARPIPSAASSLGLIAGQAPDQVAGDPWAGQDISRNAPCPCGSGQKYKHCHGVAA